MLPEHQGKVAGHREDLRGTKAICSSGVSHLRIRPD